MHSSSSAPATAPAPQFSVVVPVHNRAADVRLALAPFLAPEAAGIEVIVVDDGSTDDTPEVVQRLADDSRGARVTLVRQDNAGPGAARNRGAALARGDWVLFLDSDDIWMPWAIETFRALLADPAQDGVQILFWATHPFTDPAQLDGVAREPLHLRSHPTMLDMRLEDRLPTVASCNLGIRKDAFARLGGFTTEVYHGEDVDLLYRASELGPVRVVAAPVMMGYRGHVAGRPSLSVTDNRIRAARTLYLLRRYRAGLYPGPRAKVCRALGRSFSYAVREYFAEGHLLSAYRVYGQSAGLFCRTGMWEELVKLPLTPILHYLRPRNYRFQWPRWQ